MDVRITAVILAVQFIVIIVIGFFLFRRLRRSISANGLRYTEPQLWAIAVSVAIILAGGCANPFDPDDPPIDVGPPENPRATARPQAEAEYPAHWWNMYRRDLELLQQIPGYAGSYPEGEQGQIFVVLLEDPETQAERARSVLATRVVPATRSVPTEVQVQNAKYGMIELIRWRDIIPRDVEQLTGVVNIYGLSLARSRIHIGVQPGTDRAMLKREIKALGIPLDAVVIDFAGPVILDTGI